MSESRIPPGGNLPPHIIHSLLLPDYAYRGFGKDDELSIFLYRPMQESQSAEPMLSLIGSAESLIDKQDINSELNHLKIQRLLCLVTDMPESLGDMRLEVWERLTALDWVHMFANPGDLEVAIHRAVKDQPNYANQIIQILSRMIEVKIEEFSTNVGFSKDIPRIQLGELNIEETFGGYQYVRERHPPEALLLYNTIVSLALAIQYHTR